MCAPSESISSLAAAACWLMPSSLHNFYCDRSIDTTSHASRIDLAPSPPTIFDCTNSTLGGLPHMPLLQRGVRWLLVVSMVLSRLKRVCRQQCVAAREVIQGPSLQVDRVVMRPGGVDYHLVALWSSILAVTWVPTASLPYSSESVTYYYLKTFLTTPFYSSS